MLNANIAKRQQPYTSRFVTMKDQRIEVNPTLHGRQYYSNSIDDPVFASGDKNFSPPYKAWEGDFEYLLRPDEEMVARYKTFFAPEQPKPRLISAPDQPIGQVQGLQLPGPTVREHDGVPAPRAPDGCLLPPEAKRRRSRHQPMNGTPLDPTLVMEWPPSPPLVLSESQSEDLGTYIK
jgi:hypothetical protein